LGGAGFMGSNFTRLLVSRGAEVLVYDKLTYAGRLENLRDVLDRVSFVRGDVADEALLSKALGEFKPDVVVNFAAETHVDRSINEPAPFIHTKVVGVFAVLEAARRLGFATSISPQTRYTGICGGWRTLPTSLGLLTPLAPTLRLRRLGSSWLGRMGGLMGLGTWW